MKNNLKAARLNKGIKATDLAKALHVSKQTVSSWENNRRNPSIETYVKLADLYDVSLDFLVGREFKSDKQDFDLIEIFSKIPREKRKDLIQLLSSLDNILQYKKE